MYATAHILGGILAFHPLYETLVIVSRVDMTVHLTLHTQMAVTQAHTSNYQSLIFSQILNDPSPSAYRLHVDRNNLIRDTMAQLVTSDELINFKKPLQVQYVKSTVYIHSSIQLVFSFL